MLDCELKAVLCMSGQQQHSNRTRLRSVLWWHSPVQSSYPDFVQTDRPRFLLDPVQFPVGPKIFAEQSALLEIVRKKSAVRKTCFIKDIYRKLKIKFLKDVNLRYSE